eukprot:1289790-Prymnesium_polylepis.1
MPRSAVSHGHHMVITWSSRAARAARCTAADDLSCADQSAKEGHGRRRARRLRAPAVLTAAP